MKLRLPVYRWADTPFCNAKDKGDDGVDDDETDLDTPGSEDLPSTEQFDWQHQPSDGGLSDDASDNQSEVLVD